MAGTGRRWSPFEKAPDYGRGPSNVSEQEPGLLSSSPDKIRIMVTEQQRKNPPCGKCKHSASLHGSRRQDCKAVGCHCEGFQSA